VLLVAIFAAEGELNNTQSAMMSRLVCELGRQNCRDAPAAGCRVRNKVIKANGDTRRIYEQMRVGILELYVYR
jgi:hypothetical protein